jgi:hypothetical protein
MKRATVILTAALGLLLASASSASAAIDCSNVRDNFNRANSPNLGTGWTQQVPTTSIEGQRATDPNIGEDGLATLNGSSTGNTACADVTLNGTAVQYVAVVLDYATPDNNLFVKVQNQTVSTAFDRIFFYHGNNGDDFAPSQPITGFTTGRLAVSRSGDTVTVEIDTNLDGVPEQTYTASGANAVPNLGTGVGLGLFQHAFADNFAAPNGPPPPTPPTATPTTTNSPCATLRAKLKKAKKHHRTAKVRKLRKKLRANGC